MAAKQPKKPVMSAAFKEKAKKEKEKLQKGILSTQLHADMLRMLNEGEFSDVTLISGVDRYAAHLPLIQARLPDLYAMINGPQNGTGEHQEFDMRKLGISPEKAKDLIQFLYTSDDVKSHWDNIKHSQNNSQSNQEGNTDEQAPEDESCQTVDSSTKHDTDNDSSTSRAEDIQDDANDKSNTESIKWRKTDPKLNDPSSHIEHQQNGDMNTDDTCGTRCQNSASILSDMAYKPQAANQLGQGLIDMFTSGCGHDVTIKVEDREIAAHKFLLCNRSNYFAAMLGGSWMESNSAEINLEGASYSAVVATLCFIYGATADLPQDINIREVVYLADMYCLEDLKEVAAFHLRKDNCHFFHKPCNGCLSGVPEAILLSDSYRMTELYESAVRWVLKYLDRSWGQRSFASMPAEAIHQCSEFAVAEITCETAVSMTIQVDKLVQSLPKVKWSAPIHKEAQWLLDACIQYIAINFLSVIEQQNFEMLLTGLGWNEELLESLFNRIVHSLSENTAIPAYLAVNRLKQKASLDDWNQDALELVNRLVEMCHKHMVKNVNYFARIPAWNRIPEELQKKIKEDAVFVDDDKRVLAPRPVLSSSQRPKSQASSRGARSNAAASSARTARSAAAGGQRSTSATGQRSGSRQGKSVKPDTKWKPI